MVRPTRQASARRGDQGWGRSPPNPECPDLHGPGNRLGASPISMPTSAAITAWAASSLASAKAAAHRTPRNLAVAAPRRNQVDLSSVNFARHCLRVPRVSQHRMQCTFFTRTLWDRPLEELPRVLRAPFALAALWLVARLTVLGHSCLNGRGAPEPHRRKRPPVLASARICA
jgi:hypothetical protein